MFFRVQVPLRCSDWRNENQSLRCLSGCLPSNAAVTQMPEMNIGARDV